MKEIIVGYESALSYTAEIWDSISLRHLGSRYREQALLQLGFVCRAAETQSHQLPLSWIQSVMCGQSKKYSVYTARA